MKTLGYGIVTRAMLLGLCLVLAGCGWHLRGQASLPAELKTMALRFSPTIPRNVSSDIRRQLEASGVDLVPAEDAPYVLDVLRIESSRRALSITSDASASDLEVTNTLVFNLIAADGFRVVQEGRVSGSRTFEFDENQIVGKQREEAELRATINRDLAFQLVQRLAPYTKNRIDRARAEGRG